MTEREERDNFHEFWSINLFKKSQNRALKICMKRTIRTHTVDIHADTKMNYLHDRRESHALIDGYKRSRKDIYVQEHRANTRMADGPILKNKLPHCEAYKRSTKYCISMLWNNQDSSIRNTNTLVEYKDLLKSKLKRMASK